MPLIVPRPGAVHRQRGDDRRGRRAAVRGRRAGRPRPRRAAVAAARAPMTPGGAAGAPRVDPDDGPRHAPRGRACAPATRCRRTSSPTPTSSRRSSPRPTRRPAGGVLEIGPGLGLLTGGLLDAGARGDRRRARSRPRAFLRDRFARAARGRRSCGSIEGDALDQDLVRLVEPPYDVVANLPYHITSPILHALLGEPPRPERLVLMVQREVAERIAAPPGKMSYLSVFVQYHATGPDRVPRAAATAFEPEPAVESAVIVVEPYAADDRLDADDGGRALAARPGRRSASGARCSTTCCRGSCRSTPARVDAALAAAGIDPDRRPQTLAVGEWLALREALGPIGRTDAAGGDERGRRDATPTGDARRRSSGSRRRSST